MAMKETVSSFRMYLILIAILLLVSFYTIISQSQEDIIEIIIALILLGFAISYLYIGILLKKLLFESPNVISKIIHLSTNFTVGILGLILLLKNTANSELVIGIIITVVEIIVIVYIGKLPYQYLLRNVTSLSLEQQNKNKTVSENEKEL